MKYWCTNTEYSADIGGYICTIMNKPCPYLKPYYIYKRMCKNG